MGDGVGDGARYRAFISYSHVDKAFGRRLHRRLERYALPRRLVGRLTPSGPAPARVAPVFRDRDELPAAGDLTAEVRAALAASGALVVVCSPAAAASPWVAREIDLFRELHPDRPVLAALVGGEPADAFPPALTRIGALPVEPLAADFRREGDGPRLALLKLVAGVLGLGLDELVQRDAQRRLRGVTAVTAGAVSLALVMSGLTTYALLQRAEAQRQRGEAEALVEFMLTDLRDRLKGVGRLDVLTAVNERTLKYYAGRDVARLPAASQLRYARILQAMGEDDLARGEQGDAHAKASTARDITARLLHDKPDDPARIAADAQSEYLFGHYHYLWSERNEAAAHWRRRRDLFRQLVNRSPANPQYRRELAYAEGDLCTLSLRPKRRTPAAPAESPEPQAALRHCRAALDEMQTAAEMSGAKEGLADDLITRHAGMANAHLANGDLDAAMQERLAQDRLLGAQLAADPNNAQLRRAWVTGQLGLASLEARRGARESARDRVVKARNVLEGMIAFEPANEDWLTLRTSVNGALAYLDRPATLNKGN